LLQAIERLSERRLDDAFNRAMALYPPRTLCQHLLHPLLDRLDAPHRRRGLGGRRCFRSGRGRSRRSGCGARQQGLHHRREDAGNDEENRNSENCRTAEHAPLDED
ncbi:hypothetical protein OMR07_24755, partial [Methylobacterium organophilum]|nr:hypothetical protein [Methylobacterium organophilum]